MRIEMLDPQGISVGKRMRPLDPANVELIKRSIKELAQRGEGFAGLINPLTVTRMDGGQPDLICGLHRLIAVKDLKWDAVPCHMILSLEDKEKRLVEIAENYCSADLSIAERAAHAKEYAELSGWRIGSRGGDRKSDQSAQRALINDSANKELAKISGRDRTTVNKDLHIAKGVDGEVLRQITRTPIDTQRELLALGKLPRDEQRKVARQWTDPDAKRKVKPTTIAGQVKREQREKKLGAKIQNAAAKLDEQMYGVIIADPPWSRETYSEAGKSRDPANHYPTMLPTEIEALPVPAAPDCILFLWSTGEHLAQAMRLIEAWGFQYKSSAVWVKPSISTGYWFRTRHELVLVATKGHPVAPAPGTQIESVFNAPITAHSEKPTIIHAMVERLWPSLPKLEMFARKPREGWSGWGAEFSDFRDLEEAS